MYHDYRRVKEFSKRMPQKLGIAIAKGITSGATRVRQLLRLGGIQPECEFQHAVQI
jgi:hypothetical protein